MLERKVNPKDLQSHRFYETLLTQLTALHTHRYFRRTFFSCLFWHLLMTVFPSLKISIHVPQIIQSILDFIYQIWPLPSFKASGASILMASNIIFKVFEFFALIMYTVDIIPKVFVWKKSFNWKLTNVLVVIIIGFQMAISLIGNIEYTPLMETARVRLMTIGLSVLLLFEGMSPKEKDEPKSAKGKSDSANTNNIPTDKNPQNPDEIYYSWAEIIKHDRPGDCWIVIHGKIYDVTHFVEKHPGGSIIYDGAGGDCTPLWESYHPLSMTKNGPFEKYCIGKVRNFKTFYSWDDKFFKVVKERVEAKLPKEKRRNDYSIFLKAIVILTVYFISTYFYIFYCTYWSSILHGLIGGQIGVGIMHDGNHRSFSSSNLLTRIAGHGIDLIGGSSLGFRRTHVIGHHAFTNHYELDGVYDTTYPAFRFHKNQRWAFFHKYQHIYMWLVYGIVPYNEFFGTFDELPIMPNFPRRRGFYPTSTLILEILARIRWCVQWVIIPIYLHGFYHMFSHWFVYIFCFGYGFTLFLAVNHWTAEAAQVGHGTYHNTKWGELQVETASNFAVDSWLWTQLSGGLNLQIEHHLFPSYAHTRLPEIASIVKETCEEFGIRYFSFKSFWHALRSHYTYLKLMGNPRTAEETYENTRQMFEKK